MDPKFLGDSYDFVKRILLSVKPRNRDFLAVPMFAKEPEKLGDVLDSYAHMLRVDKIPRELCLVPDDRQQWLEEIHSVVKKGRYHLFLDPDTGIRVGDNKGRKPRAYVGMNEIKALLEDSEDMLLLCYDQSFPRANEKDNQKARSEKLRVLGSTRGIRSCYFVSHTCILAASCDEEVLSEWRSGILKLGVPSKRLEAEPR